MVAFINEENGKLVKGYCEGYTSLANPSKALVFKNINSAKEYKTEIENAMGVKLTIYSL